LSFDGSHSPLRRDAHIIAFKSEAPAVRQILAHLGEVTSPLRLAPALGLNRFDPQAQPAPDYEFDQRVAGRRQREEPRRPSWGD